MFQMPLSPKMDEIVGHEIEEFDNLA